MKSLMFTVVMCSATLPTPRLQAAEPGDPPRPRQPGGLLGGELGKYRTIEGVPAAGVGKFEKGSVLVDTLDGKKLDKPIAIVVRRAGFQGGPLELPPKTRFVIKGMRRER